MSGRISVAPCGHTGETIIGNYVKCLMGCDAPVAKPHRGEIGHVSSCSCFGCKVRRKSNKIELRTRQGKTYLSIPWDGIKNDIKVSTKGYATLTNYRFVTDDGQVVGQGTLKEVYVDDGLQISFDVSTLIKAASAMEAVTLDVKDATKTFNPNSIVVTFKGQPLTPAPSAWTFTGGVGVPAPTTTPAPPAPTQLTTAPTEAQLKQHLESGVIPDLEEVKVELIGGYFDITIIDVSPAIRAGANWRSKQAAVRSALSTYVNSYLPGNTAPATYIRTPMYCLDWAVSECKNKMSNGVSVTPLSFVQDHLELHGFAKRQDILTALKHSTTTNGTHHFDLIWRGFNYQASF